MHHKNKTGGRVNVFEYAVSLLKIRIFGNSRKEDKTS
jgi:hypothetical protein